MHLAVEAAHHLVHIRQLLIDTLEPLGYNLLVATSGEEALKLSKPGGVNIDLLLTDVVMPDMNGWELAQEFLKLRPGTKTIFMSGYAHNLVMQNDLVDEEMFYIQKPITPSLLSKNLRQVLDADESTGGINT